MNKLKLSNLLASLTLGLLILGVSIPLTIKWINTPKPLRLKKASRSTNYIYSAKSKDLDIFVGEKNSNQPTITLQNNDHTNLISFAMSQLNNNLESPNRKGNQVTFPNVRQGIDLKYQTLPNGIKEEIILTQRGQGNSFSFDAQIHGANPKMLTHKFYGHIFYDQKDNYLFHFEKPFAIDAEGNRTDDVLLNIRKQKNNNLYQIIITAPLEWLNSPERVYPVIVDPTVVHDTSSEFSPGQLNRNKDTGSGSLPSIETYYQELPADEHTVGLWHMNEGADNTCSGGEDACDSSGSNNHGTATGTTIDTTTQKLGSAGRSFNGSSDLITVTDSDDFTFGTGDFSIETWVNPSVITSNYEGIISSYNDSNGFWLSTSYGTDGSISWWNVTNGWIDTNVSLALDTWQHLAVTRTNGTINIYLDGEIINTTPNWTGNIDGGNISIGFGYTGYAYFTGGIDEVRITKGVAHTPEEIKATASCRPYSVYTSDVIDLTSVDSWTDLSWDEWGVATGDGETLYDDTNLVAQWNFNETSDTTADNAEGTTSYDGTLINMTTTGQDDSAGDGWTANNKRWGVGALMFNGTNGYVDIGTGPTNVKTVEFWANPTTTTEYFVNLTSTTDYIYANSGTIIATGFTSPTIYVNGVESDTIIAGEWQHIVVTTDTAENASNLDIGRTADTNYFHGVIDSIRIYSRALTAHEILSNYNSSNIELQTRVGADTSPDDGSWDAWSPTTGETSMDNFDGPFQYNTTDSGLVGYWPMDETTENTCSDGEDACDYQGNNHGTDSGSSVVVDGKYGKAREFSAGNYISIPDSAELSPSTTMSIEAWVYLKDLSISAGDIQTIAVKNATGDDSFELQQYNYHSEERFRFTWTDSGGTTYNARTSTSTQTITTNTWYHLVGTRDGSDIKIYVNGIDKTSATTAPDSDDTIYNTTPLALNIGSESSSDDEAYGIIDEVRLYSTTLSDSTVHQHYLEGSTNPFTMHSSTATTSGEILIEGDSSLKLETGKPNIDSHTVALYHLDETNGDNASDDIFDATINNNDGEFYGTNLATSVVNGISGKAREFNGSDDYIDIGTGPTSIKTVEFWVSPTTTTEHFVNLTSTTDYVSASSGTVSATGFTSPTIYVNGVVSSTIVAEKWQHIAITTDTAENASNLDIGRTADTNYLDGSIDEVKISDVARSAEEIAESYRMGRDHYLNQTISSTNLSAKSTLPFYIAADRPGTYLDAMVGESPYANYQPDTNTVGLWHLSEKSGSGAYIKDSSDSNNHGTPTGTTYTGGKIGRARRFNGSSDLISIPNDTSLNPSNITVEAWVKADNLTSDWDHIISKTTSSSWNDGYGLGHFNGTNDINFWINSYSSNKVTAILPVGTWVYVVGTYDGSTIKLYLNGQLVDSYSYSTAISNSSTALLIGKAQTDNNFDGLIDEVRISNTARTADEIRQTYEVGLRTHPITIDFAATGDSSNLITGSSDYNFTIDATKYGLENKGSALYLGDKIIVRETIDDTEYIAQGTVSAITHSTGAVTVGSWDTGSTFPTGGYTPNASVFKWQREYWPVADNTLSTHMDAITNLTFRLTDGAEGRTIWLDDLRSNSNYLTDKTGSTITSSTGNQYFQYRAIMTSLDESVSATLSAVTIDYVNNSTPTTPSLDSPADTATGQSLTPSLLTTTTDTDSDYLRYKIELCENVDMTTNCSTYDQTSTQTGWSGQNTQSSTAYTSGTQATYTLQSDLSTGDTYYWRSYAIDPGGTNTWSSTQGSPYSFTTSSPPSSPTTPYTEGATNPTGVTDLTPELSAIHNDGGGNSANYYQVEVNTTSDFTGTVMWNSNKTSMTTTADGVRSPDISYAGTSLSLNGSIYYWRIKFWNTNDIEGAVSVTQNFTMQQDVSNLNIAGSCRIQETQDDSSLNIIWTDTATNEDYYEIERNVDSSGWSNLITTLPANTTSHTDSTVTTNHTYRYRIAPYITSGSVYGNWCYTDTLTLATGLLKLEGIKLEGIDF